jgi:hypothetical protein
LAIFSWIEGWYKLRQRRSGSGQIGPIDFEGSAERRTQAQIEKDAASQKKCPRTRLAHRALPTGAQASPVDKPASECARAASDNASNTAQSMEDATEVENLQLSVEMV